MPRYRTFSKGMKGPLLILDHYRFAMFGVLVTVLGLLSSAPCEARSPSPPSGSLESPARPKTLQEPPAPGMFLVAGVDLLDPNFVETVVLLIDYDSEGAIGVVINRPTKTLISEAVPDLDLPADSVGRIWIGGPVAQWQLVMLARSDTELEDGRLVMGDLYFSGSRSDLENVVSSRGEYRLYAGYAGWSAGQLDQEIERGGWRVIPADPDLVFDDAPLDLWHELIERSTLHWARYEADTDHGLHHGLMP